MEEQDLFEDYEIKNNFSDNEKVFSELCPIIDKKLIEHLIIMFDIELSFDKDISFDEYKYRTGVVEVLKYLKSQYIVQNKKG